MKNLFPVVKIALAALNFYNVFFKISFVFLDRSLDRSQGNYYNI